MASLDDILTTQKNGVIAINNLNQTLAGVLLDLDSLVDSQSAFVAQYTSAPVIGAGTYQEIVGAGRLVAISVPIHSGSGQIYIYDCATVGAQANSNLIFASLPSNASSFTPYQTVNLPFTLGLSLKADANTSCVVAYRTT